MIMLIYTTWEGSSQVNTYVTSATYHFLQAVNKVTDDNTEAVELL